MNGYDVLFAAWHNAGIIVIITLIISTIAAAVSIGGVFVARDELGTWTIREQKRKAAADAERAAGRELRYPYTSSIDNHNEAKAEVREWGQLLGRWLTVRKWAVPMMIISALLAIVPSPSQLWEARINLIKLELASPENVKASVERINEISKALECKYLNTNCPAEKTK